MSEMIETVAAALKQSLFDSGLMHFVSLHKEHTADKCFELAARAAIAEMRYPTNEMIEAACSCATIGDGGGTERGDFFEEWDAAIDAALAQKENADSQPGSKPTA
jgi:hypothetical protein